MATRTAKAAPKTERPVEVEVSGTWPVDYGSVAEMIARPLEIWLRWQVDVVKAAEPVTSSWLERRREAAAATLEAVEQLATCRPTDFGRAAEIQRDWLDGAMKRWNMDMEAWTTQAATLSQEAGRYAARSSSAAQTALRRVTDETNAEIDVRPVGP